MIELGNPCGAVSAPKFHPPHRPSGSSKRDSRVLPCPTTVPGFPALPSIGGGPVTPPAHAEASRHTTEPRRVALRGSQGGLLGNSGLASVPYSDISLR